MEAIGSFILLIILATLLLRAAGRANHPLGPVFQALGGLVRFLGRLVVFEFKRNRGIHGSARFLRWFEKGGLFSRNNNGLVIDGRNRLSEKRSFMHMMVIAPTGAGKTTTLIIPQLLRLENASAVVTDPSGEIYERTAGYLQQQGFETKVLHFEDLGRSLQYNPLHRAASHTEIKQVAEILVNTAYPNSTGDSAFWNAGATNALNIFIRCLKQEDIRYQNLHNVRYLLNSFGRDGSALNHFIARTADNATFTEYQGFISQDDKVLHGALSTAKNALDKFSDPGLAELTSCETLGFETLRERKSVLYVIVPERKVGYYSPILQIIFLQMMETFMRLPRPGQPYLPIYFLLDEFGNMGRFPEFSSVLTTLRKYQCSVSLILQSIRQLVNNYGEADAYTMLEGGCATKIFFPGLGLRTCEELERILGKQTISRGALGRNPQQMGRSLLTADEIRTMPANRAILLHGNIRPAKLAMVPYYKDWTLERRSRIVPRAMIPTTAGSLDLVPLK